MSVLYSILVKYPLPNKSGLIYQDLCLDVKAVMRYSLCIITEGPQGLIGHMAEDVLVVVCIARSNQVRVLA